MCIPRYPHCISCVLCTGWTARLTKQNSSKSNAFWTLWDVFAGLFCNLGAVRSLWYNDNQKIMVNKNVLTPSQSHTSTNTSFTCCKCSWFLFNVRKFCGHLTSGWHRMFSAIQPAKSTTWSLYRSKTNNTETQNASNSCCQFLTVLFKCRVYVNPENSSFCL